MRNKLAVLIVAALILVIIIWKSLSFQTNANQTDTSAKKVENAEVKHILQKSVGDTGLICAYEPDSDTYWIKEKDDKWRCVMLPGTQLAFTAYIWDEDKKDFVPSRRSSGKKGRPTTLADVEGDQGDFLTKVKITRWHEVENGNFCVERVRPQDIGEAPMFTVWSKDLFEAVRLKQGL